MGNFKDAALEDEDGDGVLELTSVGDKGNAGTDRR